MITNVPARSGETYWWSLTYAQRAHYERCITAILDYYHGDIYRINNLISRAVDKFLTDSPLVCAVLWRLQEEINDDEDDFSLGVSLWESYQ